MKLKVLVKYLLFFAPDPIKKKIHKRIERRRLEQGMARYKRCKVSKKEVEEVLSKIDFNNDIMLHSSMLNLGRIEGGVKWLTETIVNNCDLRNHTLIVSALPFFGSFADYLKDGMVFNVAHAPIAMGGLNEKIAQIEGACRSAQPTHSVVALGKDKSYYTDTHHLDKTPFGTHSPYYKLLQRNAHVILFGATINNITFIHAVEDALGDTYPIKKIYDSHIYKISCITTTGEKVTVETPVHNKWTSARRDCSLLESDGLRNGYIRRYPLGEGFVYDVDARKLAERYCELLKEGKSIYGKCKKLNKNIILDFNHKD